MEEKSIKEDLKHYKNENKKLLKRIDIQHQIINHLSKLEDMDNVDRDSRIGFCFYYSHRQNHFQELFGMAYSKENAAMAYLRSQGSFKQNRGINKIPCDFSDIIRNELVA